MRKFRPNRVRYTIIKWPSKCSIVVYHQNFGQSEDSKKRLQIQIFGQKKITLVSHFYHKIATFHINYLLSQNHHKFMILCSKDKVTFSSQIYVPHISITKLRFCGIKIFLVLSSFSWYDILITKPSHNHEFVFKRQSHILSTNICPSQNYTFVV